MFFFFFCLLQATEHDATTKRLALEAVKEAVAGMVEIVQSYKNKHFVSEVILSSLLRRRQKEADAAILAAERYVRAEDLNVPPRHTHTRFFCLNRFGGKCAVVEFTRVPCCCTWRVIFRFFPLEPVDGFW